MASIIHFDISADDVLRAKTFYEKLFGWKIEKFPTGPREYYLIETLAKTGKKSIGGGIAKREKTDQQITNFIEVDSIDEAIAKVRELGGEIVEPKSAIPNGGYIAACKDTEGNTFGMMELKK
ncbi:VOC family protein [Maribacter sp. ACAM166]|uniref:VOC family protein n=1 Tax=Maribacter sp. ACAM166 TaxID=2508996 RepID=UPI0010FD2516|nr:VOC family protein [Maribacter sp. ACAM166]TLP81775.1 VOC family protein [Maribacter sp. ACAM166]